MWPADRVLGVRARSELLLPVDLIGSPQKNRKRFVALRRRLQVDSDPRKVEELYRVETSADRVLSSCVMVSLRRFATGVILVICIGAPILEMFDQWDRTLEDGNDTEMSLVVVALCVGVGFSVAGALVARVRAFSNRHGRGVLTSESTLTTLRTLASPIPNSRPPTALRV